MALEESVGQLSECISELSNLYESSVVTGFTITDQGHHRIVELQELVCRAYNLNILLLLILKQERLLAIKC